MDFTLKIWRQANSKAKGKFETYKVDIELDKLCCKDRNLYNYRVVSWLAVKIPLNLPSSPN
jgi:hypothetical protein